MRSPKQTPEQKADAAAAREDRNRERRQSLLERKRATEELSANLTNDIRAVYGRRGLSMFSK